AFTRFFDNDKDLDTMISWCAKSLHVLAADYANFFLFCTLTGLRASECVEAVRLLRAEHAQLDELTGHVHPQYYNPEQQVLQHYRFPDLFIRRTKAVYISIVDDSMVSIARKIRNNPSLNTLKMVTRHRSLSMRLKYCRKIYASFLRQQGVQPEIIDMLQGRIGKNIFLRHYLTPSSSYKSEVLKALEKLQRQLQV
ncbi:MAG: hypothetical protein M3270_08800, partial [Thermoproteota archaeon]|nr:hypothetical protein [Thermoproteota archaeon]